VGTADGTKPQHVLRVAEASLGVLSALSFIDNELLCPIKEIIHAGD
jgi:hypothetical protein